ncbi:MAG: acyltransferase [Pseudomonadota bacterium]
MALKRPGPSIRRRFREAFEYRASDNVWLDCLRTLAILLVLLRHGQRALEAGPSHNAIEILSLNGWAGVDLFFLLSGYLVTSGLLRSHAGLTGDGVKLYISKRFFRIAPAYFVVLALVIAGYFPLYEISRENLLNRFVAHLFFLQDLAPSDFNVVFWSLGVEVKYYAIIPIALALLSRCISLKKLCAFLLAALCLAVSIRCLVYISTDISDYYRFFRHLRSPYYACLEPFALGFFLAIFQKQGVLAFIGHRQACLVFAITLIGLSLYLATHEFLSVINAWDATVQPFVLSLFFAALVGAATQMGALNTRLEPLFRYGARLSYSLYLVHFPLIPLSLAMTHHINAGTPGFWVFYALLSISHAIALLIFIETPCMALARATKREKAEQA